MYQIKKNKDPNIIQPKFINLSNITTDEKGKIHLDLKNWNLQFAENDEVSLDFLELPMASLHNLNHSLTIHMSWIIVGTPPLPVQKEGKLPFASTTQLQHLNQVLYQQKLTYSRQSIDGNGTSEIIDTVSFPKCKVATLDELQIVLNFMLNYMNISIELSSNQILLWHFQNHCLVQNIYLPISIAKSLGFLRKDEVLPLFLRKIYQDKLTWNKITKDGIDLIHLTRVKKDGDFLETKILLPYHKDTFIWNELPNPFQIMIIEFDKMKFIFTGNKLTKTLAVIPLQPEKSLIYYKPLFETWKVIQMGLHNFLTLTFYDSKNKPFKNITLNLILKFRKNTLL